MSSALKVCKKTCSACPFRKESVPGYLGSYTHEQFLEVHYQGEVANPCHPTVKYEGDDWLERHLRGENGLQCKGQAEFFANSFKLPRPGSDIPIVERSEDIMSGVLEFMQHHRRFWEDE